jgi:hypothetical protein
MSNFPHLVFQHPCWKVLEEKDYTVDSIPVSLDKSFFDIDDSLYMDIENKEKFKNSMLQTSAS